LFEIIKNKLKKICFFTTTFRTFAFCQQKHHKGNSCI